MADISRETFTRAKAYREVVFQKGRPILDFEHNELQKILRLISSVGDLGAIGNSPFGDGLKVTAMSPVAGGVNILPGSFFDKGDIVELFTEEVVTALQTSGTQAMVNNVYLTYTETEIGSGEDPDIYDATINIETAKRIQLSTAPAVTLSTSRLFLPLGQEAIFLAQITIPPGQTVVRSTDIEDLRLAYNANYVVDGFTIAQGTGTVTVTGGVVICANVSRSVSTYTYSLVAGSRNYLWLDEEGEPKLTTAKPAPPSVLLYEVTTDDDNAITEINDVRQFQPPILGLINLYLTDFLSPKRQLYAGDTTTQTTSDTTPRTAKSFTLYNDPQVAFDIREVGILIRARSINTQGNMRVLIDDEVKAQLTLPSDGLYRMYKVNLPVTWATSGLHTVAVSAWNDAPPEGGVAGSVIMRLFECYVKESTFARRVLLFGEEGEDTVTATTAEVFKEASFYSDPQVGFAIQKLSYVGQFRASGSAGTVQIIIDGQVYREFTVAVSTSWDIYKGTIQVAWPTESLHTVQIKMATTVDGGAVQNRLLEMYCDQV